jgi:dihydroflavonol-4-reductase
VKYLVTGATGFLGTHLVRTLEAHGHEVVRFSRSTGNDVLDARGVELAVRSCDGVFHCAGRVSRRPQDAEELYRLHVDGTRIVLDACERAGVRRVVVASSSGTVAVSADAQHEGSENDPTPIGLLAKWPYYRAKLFAERVALSPRAGSLEVVCVNPSLLLGPGDVNGSSTGDIRMFLERSIFAVPAGGLSFVDARDAADAMRLAMDRGRSGERYLVGGCNLTIRDLLRRLSAVSGVEGPWAVLPRSPGLVRVGASWIEGAASRLGLRSPVDPVAAEMAQYFWYVDSTKARRDLGWSAREANVTLYDTVEDLRARGVVWPR